MHIMTLNDTKPEALNKKYNTQLDMARDSMIITTKGVEQRFNRTWSIVWHLPDAISKKKQELLDWIGQLIYLSCTRN